MNILQCHRQAYRDTSILVVERPDGTVESREYYIRGGCCFPVLVGDAAIGHLVVMGARVDRPEVAVLDERPFSTMDPVYGEDYAVLSAGAAPWLNLMWAQYGARFYYYRQSTDAAAPMRAEAARSTALDPKPGFIEAPMQAEAELALALARARADPRLVINPVCGVLLEQLRRREARPGAAILDFPAAWAFGCCLLGLTRHPWANGHMPLDQQIRLDNT